MMDKDFILAEIRRTAAENDGAPLGMGRFERETGIKPADWHGKYWARWGDALREAGLAPNALNAAREESELLEHLASLVRELGRFPVVAEIRLKARNSPGFPWHNTFARFGPKSSLAARLRDHCVARGDEETAAICADAVSRTGRAGRDDSRSPEKVVALGAVYLMKFGKHFKIGKTNAVGRREREIAVQLPDKLKTVHVIRTDDPAGIEAYWHNRFADKRANGEWFALDAADVAAFRRRKFM